MEISRRFSFSAGHTIYGHRGKCHNLHGHNYQGELIVSGKELDEKGMLVDFGILAEVTKCLEDRYDHRFIMWKEDPRLDVMKALEGVVIREHQSTVESLTLEFMSQAHNQLISMGINNLSVSILLYETENCYARA